MTPDRLEEVATGAQAAQQIAQNFRDVHCRGDIAEGLEATCLPVFNTGNDAEEVRGTVAWLLRPAFSKVYGCVEASERSAVANMTRGPMDPLARRIQQSSLEREELALRFAKQYCDWLDREKPIDGNIGAMGFKYCQQTPRIEPSKPANWYDWLVLLAKNCYAEMNGAKQN